jgi:hypothetical protein
MHVVAEWLRDGNRAALAVDAYKDEFGTGDKSVIPQTPSGLAHGEAGTTVMSERLRKPENVTGEGSGTVVDDGFAQRGPSSCPGEYVHSGPPQQHFPASSLEEAKKGRLVQVAEGVALIWVDN